MKCFVIMPFGLEGSPEHQRNLKIFEDVIRAGVIRSGLVAMEECMRVDLIDRPGSIVDDIVNGLYKAEIVIADLSGRNPNVFYELGARHVLRRGTILITQSRDDVPFHLLTDRVILYGYPMDTAHQAGFEAKLVGQIKSIASSPDAPDSPFSQRIESIGRSYTRVNLALKMPIRADHVASNSHLYSIDVVIQNNGHRKVQDLDWEVYWPAGIPIKQKNIQMTALKEDPAKKSYIRFRNSASLPPLGPGLEYRALVAQFEVNYPVYDSGDLKKSILLRVYADGEYPIDREFSFERPDRQGVDF